MDFSLVAQFTFSDNISTIQSAIQNFIQQSPSQLLHTKDPVIFSISSVKNNLLSLTISSQGSFRPHNALLQLKNAFSKEFGKTHRLGVRDISISSYSITFELEKKPLKPLTIPFADLTIKGKNVTLLLKKVDEEFLRRNYIDRMIARVKEKVDNQYYEGKKEFWKLIWESQQKTPVWSLDPTEEMEKLGWIQQGPTKGKWFYRAEITAVFNAMQSIAIKEVLEPLGFHEVIASHIIPFDIWLKTGHMEGMPGEFYYVAEPKSRDIEKWERFVDLVKITKEVSKEELQKNIALPTAGICYAQCPMMYWSLKGKTIAEASLPVLFYDKTAVSNRYESGGRHGIERVDEFHRIEPVYIGTREQLLELREQLLKRYKHVFNDIFDLEWRMAWVTPWYMQQAGEHSNQHEQDTGTIDFEAYMPYRGNRKTSEWLEFQNLSILGDKYIKAFNIKAQKSTLWSGCSGIGLERWAAAFLAQKGFDPKKWPEGFRHYLDTLPKGVKFM